MSKKTATNTLGYYCLICSSILMTSVNCDVKLLYNNNFCLNQPVEYQCTVRGSSNLLFLTWRVLDESGSSINLAITYTSVSSQADRGIGGVFTVEQISESPLISNISFTVQSSINGYTIICDDTQEAKNLTIQVYGDVIIHTDAFTNSSVNISWTGSPSYCNTTYTYNVSSSALEQNIIMESTSNSVMVEGLVPSEDQYCIMVTAIEEYSTRFSKSTCFIFNVPSAVTHISSVVYQSGNSSVTVTWNDYKRPSINRTVAVQPPLTGYIMSIVCTTDTGYTISNQSHLILPDTLSYTFHSLPVTGTNYTVTVFAVNTIGLSLPSTETIAVPIVHRAPIAAAKNECSQPLRIPQPTPLPVSDTVVVTLISSICSGGDHHLSSSSQQPLITISPSPLQESTNHLHDNDTSSILLTTTTTVAGISVAVTVPVTAVITVIITVTILYLCNRKHGRRHKNGKPSEATNGNGAGISEPINNYSRPPTRPSSTMFINHLATDKINDMGCDTPKPFCDHDNDLELTNNVAYEQLSAVIGQLFKTCPQQYEISVSSHHSSAGDEISNHGYDDVIVNSGTRYTGDNDQQTSSSTAIYDTIASPGKISNN